MQLRRANRGIAIREVAITLLVLLVMVGVMIYCLASRTAEAAHAACEQNMASINVAIEKWFFDKGRWPANDLHDLAQDKAYFPSGVPRCPVTGEPYRMDLRTYRVARHPH